MTTPACAHCGRPIDLNGDAWRLLPGNRYEHLACPISAEMKALPAQEATAPAEKPLPRFVTMDEAADFLRVSKATIRNKIRAGELPAKRLRGGQTVLVEVRDVLALLDDYTGRE